MAAEYPRWKFYPTRTRPPAWVDDLAGVFAHVRDQIDSTAQQGVKSDAALAALRPGLQALGYQVETSKRRAGKIYRPVLFGDQGRPRVAYEVDAFDARYGVVLEVEAGRGAANNADYRDLVRTSLIVDASYLVLAMMQEYRGGGPTMRSFERTREQLDAIYASDRLKLPFEGVVLIGY